MATKSFDRSVVLTNKGYNSFEKSMHSGKKINLQVEGIFRSATKDDKKKIVEKLSLRPKK